VQGWRYISEPCDSGQFLAKRLVSLGKIDEIEKEREHTMMNNRCSNHAVVSCLKCAKSFMQDNPSFFNSSYVKELETLKYKGLQGSKSRLEAQDKFAQNLKKESEREKDNPSDTLVRIFGFNDEVID
jgi:hypothetical protein